MKTGELLKRLAIGSSPRRTAIRTAIIAVVLIIVCRLLFLPMRVNGISMEPTYSTGNFIFINTLTYALHEPRRGDVVAVRYAGRSVMLLKRIIGLPGETIAFQDGILHVNGAPVDEPYVTSGCDWTSPEAVAGPDEYYVVGDNRGMDMEDHTQGFAERTRIIGGPLF